MAERKHAGGRGQPAGTSEPAGSEFAAAFRELVGLLRLYAPHGLLRRDDATAYHLDSPMPGPNGKPLFFGSVEVRKRYVSFYLMPVYVNPELLDGISPALEARMQGKSCFNFRRPEPALFAELRELAERGFRRWREDGRI